jgi:hypothetical protein
LAQPIFQFVALAAVLLALGRCSPLSPSINEEKMSALKSANSGSPIPHDGSAEEQDIKREMKQISTADELPLISESDFTDHILPNSIQADKGTDLTGVQNLFRQRELQAGSQRNSPILVLRLTSDQENQFFQTGSLRMDLAEALNGSMAADVRQSFFTEIHKLVPRGDITVKSYLVLPDDEMDDPEAASAIPVSTKFQMAILPNDQKAWIQLTRQSQNLDDQQQKLIESAKGKSLSMELVLE